LWGLYNGKLNPGESMRVFPLSNWTERDIWHYILLEQIPIVPLYFAKKRKGSGSFNSFYLRGDSPGDDGSKNFRARKSSNRPRYGRFNGS
jgi:3'-phosphoadenosine 5'-phosphosulfate sulfotransferase (PAPS reductase)/FAD synthetase